MEHLAKRNPSSGVSSTDHRNLYFYLAVQKITYLYDDELFEGLKFVDHKKTGKSEELLDAYLIVDQVTKSNSNCFNSNSPINTTVASRPRSFTPSLIG